jgi:hypothetical protein
MSVHPLLGKPIGWAACLPYVKQQGTGEAHPLDLLAMDQAKKV